MGPQTESATAATYANTPELKKKRSMTRWTHAITALHRNSQRLFSSCIPRNMAASEALMAESVKDPKKADNIFAFKALDIDGNMIDLGEKYKGHVCIIVNVASK